MTDDIKKTGKLVKAKTPSLQKRASNIVSRGLSDLALLDVKMVKSADVPVKEFQAGDIVYIHTPDELTEEQASEWTTLRSKAITFCRNGQYDKAIEYYNKVIQLAPNHATDYWLRGNAYYRKGQYDMAIEDYNKAVVLDPDDANAYNNRGLVYERLGNKSMAISDYKKACDLGYENGCKELQRVLRQQK